MSSAVIFGKASAGKSTLVGAIVAHDQKIDLDAFRRKLEEEVPGFDAAALYSMIVDDSKPERERRSVDPPGGHSAGSTKRRHYRNVNLKSGQKATIIDTPGAEHRSKERVRGMFSGDTGVFCIEVLDVVDEKFLAGDGPSRAVMRALGLWGAFARKKVIIALTMMDKVEFSREVFDKACYVLGRLLAQFDFEVDYVPTSVITEELATHNVTDRSPLMDWYDGLTLMEALERHLFDDSAQDSSSESLLLSLDREVPHARLKAGRVWQAKILNGELVAGQRIRLAPVLLPNGEHSSVSATVRTIRRDVHSSEDNEILDRAASGMIVGLDLTDVCGEDGRRMQKRAFEAVHSSCGFDSARRFAMSKSFAFTVPRNEGHAFSPTRQFGLVWFGWSMQFKVVDVAVRGGSYRVHAESLVEPIAWPQRRVGVSVLEDVVIRSEYAESSRFLQARLEQIGDVILADDSDVQPDG